MCYHDKQEEAKYLKTILSALVEIYYLKAYTIFYT